MQEEAAEHYTVIIKVNRVVHRDPERRNGVPVKSERVIEEVTNLATRASNIEAAVKKAKAILDLEVE